MATGRTRPTRLRLTFNFRTGSRMQERIRGFASVLVEDVAMNLADQQWQEVKAKVEKQLTIDAFREISRMAQLYKQLTVGLSSNRSGLHGTLTPASAPAKGQEQHARYRIGGPATSWAKRQRSYLTRKAKSPPKGVGHKRWFQHSGHLGSVMGRGKTWTSAYGPVKVDVKRHTNMSVADAQRTANSQATPQLRKESLLRFNHGVQSPAGTSIRVHVASIRVAAMEQITPAMLPALRDGSIDNVAPDGRKTGLVGQFGGKTAMHLAGSGKPGNFVPYRHTIEPFLGFVLTRAIPNAVARRLADTLGADIRADGRGRDDKFGGGFVRGSRLGR